MESLVYPVSDVAKSQGFMRIHFRTRSKSSTSVSTTTQLPIDVMIENYLKKAKHNRFSDFHQLKNVGSSINSIFIGLFVILCIFLF